MGFEMSDEMSTGQLRGRDDKVEPSSQGGELVQRHGGGTWSVVFEELQIGQCDEGNKTGKRERPDCEKF